ncbi:MAG: CBS domain-containing protein [Nitrososphaerota archaeon]|nr:CBS domain-containing protein [Nitrososphaerota archaeon]
MSDNILVREIMTTQVKVIREDTTLQEVIATLSSFDINSIVVVQGKRPVGIITSRDALVRGFEQGLPAREIKAGMVASAPVITIDQEASLEEAADLMRKKHIKHLVVISNSELVEIISAMDIVFAMPSMLNTMEEVCRR